MNPRVPSFRTRLTALGATVWLVAGALVVLPQLTSSERATATECPPGTEPANADIEQRVAPDQRLDDAPQYQGGTEVELSDVLGKVACVSHNRPESFVEMAAAAAQQAAIRTAPFTSVAPGANRAAYAERAALVGADVPGADGTFEQYGTGPLIFDDPRFNEGQIAQLGLVDSTGRIDEYEFFQKPDAPKGEGLLFAAIGTGGIWLSEDLGATFRDISKTLPAAVVGSVAYSPPREGHPQGTVLTITGEHTFGGNAYLGNGAFYSDDLGATWQHAEGVPDGALGFAIEVDPVNPDRVYAATQRGLFQSIDGGRTYRNVNLPTGLGDTDPLTPECTGVIDDIRECNFANMVTDIVLKAPGGTGADKDGGQVIAAVGWRAGMRRNPSAEGRANQGTVQSPNNGVYRSDSGDPGTFERLPGLDSAAGGKRFLGRVEFGPAVGELQDHDVLYAIVEDAVLFNGGVGVGDVNDPAVPGGLGTVAGPTVLNGVYVSRNFGTSWTLVTNDEQIAQTCTTNGSALCLGPLAQPGQQAWYDMWIEPDPTLQVNGVPSRVTFGLEEIWQNTPAAENPATSPPVDRQTPFEVFGRYFSGETCAFGLVPTGQICPFSRGVIQEGTTHPDQHAGLYVPTEEGVALLVGHDGGFSRQDAEPPTQAFDNNRFQLEQNNGLQTLLPYSSVIANDGTVWAGLQDNGHLKIEPEPVNDSAEPFAQYSTFGGDGTFAAVAPEDSDYALESVQGGRMNLTSDGGLTWRDVQPPASNKRFVNPFVMDPLNSDHVTTGGRQINESLAGRDLENGEDGNSWVEVFDLGTTRRDTEAPSGDANVEISNGMSAIDTYGDVTYVGFCGACDILNQPVPFRSGIATNMTGAEGKFPKAGTRDGWGFAEAEGLPDRFITSVAIDPYDSTGRTVYVALGGYSRRWVPPNSVNDANANIGEGHLYKSTDAGATFTDISGDLPDIPASWVAVRGEQLLVGTDNGAYISSDKNGGPYAVMGGDQLPAVPITSIDVKADDPDKVLVGTYGRSIYLYDFPEPVQPGPGPSPTPNPTTEPIDREVLRVGGEDRIQTAILTSRERFPEGGADTVVLSRGNDYADALAGAPYAATVDASILLTPSNRLDDGVRAEIRRLGAETAVLLGGNEAIEPSVAEELRREGLTVERIGGGNRFDTARLLAQEIGGTEVFVAEGFDVDPTRGWPDALAVAPLAAKLRQPILLVDTNGLPQETADAIESLDVSSATVVGGTAAVSEETEQAVADLGPQTSRVAGATRYETSAIVAGLGLRNGLAVTDTWFATGANWPDALSSGPTIAATNGTLLLVDPSDLENSEPTRRFFAERACGVLTLRILGGTEAISQNVQSQGQSLLDACPEPGPEPQPTPSPTPPPAGGPVQPPPPFNPMPVPQPAKTFTPFAGPFGWEQNNEGWTVSREGVNAWTRKSPGGAGSTTAFAVAPYNELEFTTLTSPEMESPGGTLAIAFDTRYDVEGGGFDEFHFEYSTDGGETYERPATFGGRNAGFPEFEALRVEFEVPEGPFTVRFLFESDEICSSVSTPLCADTDGYEGARVDNVVIGTLT